MGDSGAHFFQAIPEIGAGDGGHRHWRLVIDRDGRRLIARVDEQEILTPDLDATTGHFFLNEFDKCG